MPRRVIVLLLVIAIAVIVIVWWQRPPSRARRIAAHAATAEQTRLWQQVAAKGTPGLERIPVPATPLQRREPARPSPQGPTPNPPRLPPGVVNVARVIATSETGPWAFSGKAAVVGVSGDRVDLNLGAGRTLSFLARVGGQPLGVAAQQTVDLTVKSRPGIFDRQQILAVRTAAGKVIISAVENSDTPVVLRVLLPPLTLVASQTGQPIDGAMRVVVDVGGDTDNVPPGRSGQVGGVSFSLLGSNARPPGSSAADGSPFAIDLIAWRTP
jgi:type II secretory pathway pseudopilin PulG